MSEEGFKSKLTAILSADVEGYPDQALQSLQEAMTIEQELSRAFTRAFALVQASTVYQFRREVQAVQKHAEALIALSTDQGFPQWLGYGTIMLG